jgi:hypothetical protein
MVHAIEVAIGVRNYDLALLFTEDVTAWSPNLLATSLDELKTAFDSRNSAVGNVAVDITALDVVDDKAFAEWVVKGDHVGTMSIDDLRVEATNRRLQLGGISVAEFEKDRIRAFRSYFDAVSLLEQMVDEA